MARAARKASGSVPRIPLVLGLPGTVASRVAGRLAAGPGGVVAVVGRGCEVARGGTPPALPAGVVVHEGVPGAVDLGLPGAVAASIAERLGTIMVLDEPSGVDWHPPSMDAAREIVAFASSASPEAAIIALFPHLPPTARAWPLERVLAGRGSDLVSHRLRCGIPVDPEGPWQRSGPGDVLKLIVLLHCCIDLRRTGSAAGRRLELTHAALAADAVIGASSRGGDLLPTGDLRDPAAPTIAHLNSSLGTLLDSVPGSGPVFRGNCRRHRDRLVRRWFGGQDPGEVLLRWTSDEASSGGEGPRVARLLGSEWHSSEEVFASCLAPVVRSMRADIASEAESEDGDALLG